MSQTIYIQNKLSEIEKLAQVLEVFGKAHRISAETIGEIRLALDEIITNIISYGYTDAGPHRIEVFLDILNKQIVLEIRDNARPFNPLGMSPPNILKPLNERKIGGLGIFVARKMMDEFDYKFENGYNILTMKKKIRNDKKRVSVN